MLKRNNKKGFTLAELLIVVAIIAVLVAIAVPLFVGSLEKAEQRVFESNVRSLKSMAVSGLVTSEKFTGTELDGDKKLFAVGSVKDDGSISLESWEDTKPVATTAASTWEEWKTNNKTGKICVEITKSTITDYAPKAVPGG